MTQAPHGTNCLLEVRDIRKRFGAVVALDGVDFSVQPGEIHALIGQNGAGKSTLMKILAGVYAPDSGEIWIEERAVQFSHPRDALRLGIGTVYQDLSLVPKLSVTDNIFLGREAGGFIIDQTAMTAQADALLASLGVINIDVTGRADSLPLAQQQLVEITKVLSHEPRILILDEPTAALADDETRLLFNLLDGLRARGIAIIFISHRFQEILQHCDRATVLRNGRVVGTLPLQGVSEEHLVEMTIGARSEAFFHSGSARRGGDIVLEVENLRVGRAVNGVSFALRSGEIVGVTGLLGAGQNELARALFGSLPEVSGLIRRNGQPVMIASPKTAIRLGIGLLTEHRKTEGLVLDMSVKDNITLPSLSLFRRVGTLLNSRQQRQTAAQWSDRLRVKTPSVETSVNSLSGGNQQKVILAKWLLRDLDILIFISPTQGIDVGAKSEIYQQLSDLADAGKAIVVVSEDLLEILGVSDRIFVMRQGRLTHTLDRGDADEEQLLLMIQGASHDA
jgi:ribose transport system ATP-binding protein